MPNVQVQQTNAQSAPEYTHSATAHVSKSVQQANSVIAIFVISVRVTVMSASNQPISAQSAVMVFHSITINVSLNVQLVT